MTAYCDGDPDAFDGLYARHKGPVYRYVRRLAPDLPDPDAVFQEVWLRVIRRRTSWARNQPFRPWLYTLAHNIVIDQVRAARHRRTEPLEAVAELAARQPDVERWQFIRDCIERLLGLLAALPDAQRSAFLLKEEAGLSLQEIAEIADVGRETVKSRLRYAMKTLRRGLEGCEHA